MGLKKDAAQPAEGSKGRGLTRGYRAAVGVNVGLIVLLGLLLTGGAIALVQSLAYRTDLRFDWNEDRRFTLDDTTVRLLRELDSGLEVTFVTGFDQRILSRTAAPDGTPSRDALERLYRPILLRAQDRVLSALREWRKLSPHVKVRVVYDEANPAEVERLARGLGLEREQLLNRAFLTLEGRRRMVPLARMMPDIFWGDMRPARGRNVQAPRDATVYRVHAELTAALAALIADDLLPVGLLQDVGSPWDPSGPDFRQLERLLADGGFELQAVAATPKGVAACDAAALLVLHPTRGLNTALSRALSEWSEDRDGRMLLSTAPELREDFGELLEPFGVTARAAVIGDRTHAPYGARAQEGLASGGLWRPPHPIVAGFVGAGIVFQAGPSRPLDLSPDASPGSQRVVLMAASSEAVTIPIRYGPEGQPEPDKAAIRRVERAPPLALALTRPTRSGEGLSRVVVLGASEGLLPRSIAAGSLLGNRDFLLNALRWLTERESDIGLSPRAELVTRYLDPARMRGPFTWVGAVALPLLAVVLGWLAFWMRRRT